MMHALLSLAVALGVLAYWVICRQAALKHQMRAADLLVAYLDREDISERDKDIAHTNYRMLRAWVSLPLIALVSPFVIAKGVFSKDFDSMGRADSDRNEIMDASMMMYVTKNPATSIIFMSAVLISIGVIAPIGMAFNRLKSIPSLESLFRSIAITASDSAHIHSRQM